MKYIDADLLRKKIEKLKKEYDARVSSTLMSEGLVYMGKVEAINKALCIIDSLQQEQQEVDLEKFTEKMNTWKARYNNYPDNIPIKGTMAFTARMFYMYPNVAREWYDSLRKVTLD